MKKEPGFDGTYGWSFKFNSFTGEWRAAKDEHHRELSNNNGSQDVVRSKCINTLCALLNKHDGLSAQEINKLY